MLNSPPELDGIKILETDGLKIKIKDTPIECIKPLKIRRATMIEPILLGIVLGLVPITLAGLFVAAYTQYRRDNRLNM